MCPCSRPCIHRLPIVAYTNTAVPETVQGAGLILPNKEPARVAAAIDRVVRDDQLRSTLAEAAPRRVGTFALPRVQDGFAVRPRGGLRGVNRVTRPPATRGRHVPMRVAFVVPRYGTTIIGGAETAARACWPSTWWPSKGWEVEVLTSCAEDFVTWDDVIPPGSRDDQRCPGEALCRRGRERPVVPSVLGVAAGRPGWRLDRRSRAMDRPAGTGDSGAG